MTASRTCPGKIAALLALTYSLAASSFAGDKILTEVTSPHFRVLTDGSDHQARRIAREFEEMRLVFANAFPNMRLSTGAPLVIFAVQDENGMKALAPALFSGKGPKPAGIFQHGWEKQFAVVRLDQDIPGAYQVVYHEYVHSLLHTNFRWLPTWLDEGLAESYGNTRFEGKKLYVGAPSVRVNYLRGRVLIPLETLLTVNPYAFFRGDEKQIDTFYAESWALVHYMLFGEGMERGKKLTHFYSLLQGGEPELKAFRDSFGDPKDVQEHLERYITAFAFQSWVMNNSDTIQEKDFLARKLSPAESAAEIAGYRLWEHDAPEATELVDKALKGEPNLGMAHEEKAFIYFKDGQDEDALKEFSRAYELDKQRYLSLYFKTMMSAKRETPEQLEALRLGLLMTVQTNPQFAPAYVQLAFYHLDVGHEATALTMARKAEALEPSRAGYHLLAGEILLRLKHDKEAADIAKFVAERWRGPDHNEAVSLWNQIPAASRPADTILVEEVPEQSQIAEGTLKSVTCPEKGEVEFVLQRGNDLLTFHSKGREMIGYSDTLWYGSDHFTPCHHIDGMHALIRYRPPASGDYAGDWLSLELRDALPPVRVSTPDHDAAKDSPAKKSNRCTASASRPLPVQFKK